MAKGATRGGARVFESAGTKASATGAGLRNKGLSTCSLPTKACVTARGVVWGAVA